MIEFLCPNGHKITCSEDMAGKAAKCPQCGAGFQVPAVSEPAPTETAGSGPAPKHPLAPADAPKPAPAKPEEEREFDFLCPNGHRLHGPISLQGRPGECPECGERFYIPNFEEVPEDVDTKQELGVGRSGGQPDSGLSMPQAEETSQTAEEETPPAKLSGSHALCDLFVRLWAQRPSEACVELHLNNGETFVPDRFAKQLSDRDYAMFAIKEPGGKHTLTLVAWDSIVRVDMRGVESLPKEMTEQA